MHGRVPGKARGCGVVVARSQSHLHCRAFVLARSFSRCRRPSVFVAVSLWRCLGRGVFVAQPQGEESSHGMVTGRGAATSQKQ